MKKRSCAGFTLIELMVVAIIVAILAAVAIPLMSANRKRAMSTEGDAGLGMLRSSLRAMYAETGSYLLTPSGSNMVPAANYPAVNIPGVGQSDLDGKYFQHGDYYYISGDTNHYTVSVVGNATSAVAGVTITLNQDGNFTRIGL